MLLVSSPCVNAGAPPSAGFETLMPNRWANLFGCTFPMASVALDNGPCYAEFYAANSAHPHVIVDPRTMIGPDLIYMWGCNPIENQIQGQIDAGFVICGFYEDRGCYALDNYINTSMATKAVKV